MNDAQSPLTAFSPLALTQALPFLPLSQSRVDYQVDRRSEEHLIETLLAKASTRVFLVKEGMLAVPRGQGELVDYESVHMRLAYFPGEYLSKALRDNPRIHAYFLGSDPVPNGQAHDYVALDITRAHEDSSLPDAAHVGADDAFGPDGETAAPASADALERAERQLDWVGLRGFAPHCSALEAGLATSAATLSMWHISQRFCPRCGAATSPALSGWGQRCSNPEDGKRLLFPRIEPAAITAIVDASNRLLIQRNAAWSENFYSVSAGFVEAGENLEHAARRESAEETGIPVGELKYLGSQPWPFPSSLMVAFKGRALDTHIHVDGHETLDAMWVTKDDYMSKLTAGEILSPGKATIARYMIEEWLGYSL
ncbi:NAD(+) diphosphatase [Bifidobacterium crudilactis]|uniref:NAD(+) diphosphatase n=1 Tax=Bifidobacterium crudilactis TaxID=327277 RepID=UPI002352CDB4|nr:NAD(+) diphosphatase [Bifidobacterium crudilactis]